jgi:GTP-binding protein HflX
VVIPTLKGTNRKNNTRIKDDYSNLTGGTQEKDNIQESESNHVVQDDNEILGLCETLGYQVQEIFTQRLQNPNPTYYIGSGKTEQLREYTSENQTLSFAVFDCPLKPNQVFNLETKLGLRVIDRSTLILMIFLHHARTREAKLQVEYAILRHQLPYITELVRRTKLGEHPGLLAGGEYKVDEYYRLTNSRIRKIRQQLTKIKVSREQQRKNRRSKGFVLVSLAGYTNAGKSSILRLLTKAQTRVDEQLFSTVSPKTRRFRNTRVLFTDTVGFIKDIPTQLIEAFKSTLEEIIDANHILLIVDISEEPDIIKQKLKICLKIIDQLLTERVAFTKSSSNNYSNINQKQPQKHIVFNKIDIDPDHENKMQQVLSSFEDYIEAQGINSISMVSCRTKVGLGELITKVNEMSDENVSRE